MTTTETPTSPAAPATLGDRIKNIFARKRTEEAETAGAEYARLISLPVEELSDAEALSLVGLGVNLGYIAPDGSDAGEVIDLHREKIAIARRIYAMVVEAGTPEELRREVEASRDHREQARKNLKSAEEAVEQALRRVHLARAAINNRSERIGTLNSLAKSYPFLPIPVID
jgi:DNA repair ATPase RecN